MCGGISVTALDSVEFLYQMILYTMHPQPTVVSYTFEELTNHKQSKVAATWTTKD